MKLKLKEEDRGKGTHEFTNNALVDKDGNGDAEDADKGEVAASPTEIELEILSSSAPILYEFVLVCFHSSCHSSFLFLFSSLLPNQIQSLLLFFLLLPPLTLYIRGPWPTPSFIYLMLERHLLPALYKILAYTVWCK